MNLELSRRQFLGTAGAGLAGTALGAFGFGEIEAAHAETIRSFKLVNTTETRNTCPYCSVACGIIMYSKGDLKKGEPAESSTSKAIRTTRPIAARSVRRARRCRLRAAPTRLKYPMLRRPGSDKFEADFLGRSARPHRAADEGRPRQELHRQEQRRRHCQPLAHHRLPGGLRDHQRNGVRDLQGGAQRRHAGVRQPGACLTRPNGGQFGPNIRPWRDDEFVDRHQEHGSRHHHGRQCRRGASLRLQMGDRGQGQSRRQADRGRPALYPLGRGRGLFMRRSGKARTSPSCWA